MAIVKTLNDEQIATILRHLNDLQRCRDSLMTVRNAAFLFGTPALQKQLQHTGVLLTDAETGILKSLGLSSPGDISNLETPTDTQETTDED